MRFNAQLRILNQHLASSVGSTGLRLPTSTAALGVEEEGPVVGGISSFGYSGTIAHAIISILPGSQSMAFDSPTVSYRRVAFYWDTPKQQQQLSGASALAPAEHIPFLGLPIAAQSGLAWEQQFRPHELTFLQITKSAMWRSYQAHATSRWPERWSRSFMAMTRPSR